jgi:hypothetical protein
MHMHDDVPLSVRDDSLPRMQTADRYGVTMADANAVAISCRTKGPDGETALGETFDRMSHDSGSND